MAKGYSKKDVMNWGTMQDPLIFSNAINSIPFADPVNSPTAPSLRSRESYLAPVPSTPDIGLRPADTSTTSWTDYLTGPNLINAGVTALVSSIPTFFTMFSSSKIYDLYKQQEQLYIENANEQARRIQLQGDIALANLEARHAVSQGTNELAVAASGAGSMSGSFLDKLMANRKYDAREEFTQSLETLYAVGNAKREGLLNAYGVAGKAMQYAYEQRSNILENFMKGLSRASDSLTKDIQQGFNQEAKDYFVTVKNRQTRLKNDYLYSTPDIPKNTVDSLIMVDPSTGKIENFGSSSTPGMSWGATNSDLLQ